MSELFKGVLSIWNRLFDHRANLNGEIQFFLKEFELKRSDQEVENLFSTLETITELRDTQVDRSKSFIDSLFPQSQLALSQSSVTCKQIEQLEAQGVPEDALLANREARKKDWDTFIDNISEDYDKINLNFDKKEADLQEFYRNLSETLTNRTLSYQR